MKKVPPGDVNPLDQGLLIKLELRIREDDPLPIGLVERILCAIECASLGLSLNPHVCHEHRKEYAANETTVQAETRAAYEPPKLFEAGSFQEETGFIGWANTETVQRYKYDFFS
jgi:hypothetical protein